MSAEHNRETAHDFNNDTPQSRFEINQPVKVKRTSGQVEGGWTIILLNEKDAFAIVGKDGQKTKRIRLEELEKWQDRQ